MVEAGDGADGGARVPQRGDLPIHYAADSSATELGLVLLKAHPKGASKANKVTPARTAAHPLPPRLAGPRRA